MLVETREKQYVRLTCRNCGHTWRETTKRSFPDPNQKP